MVCGNLRITVDPPLQVMIRDCQDLMEVVEQTRKMCKETPRIVSTTQCDALLRHLLSRHEDIVRKVEEMRNVLEEREKRGGYWARF